MAQEAGKSHGTQAVEGLEHTLLYDLRRYRCDGLCVMLCARLSVRTVRPQTLRVHAEG